ncbi:MAG: tetratricopeptide repeat protein [Vampirovibrionales bacterium]|nr:tetratricopeptide repeat protein [Vampirovibrionales bacterium]
MASHPAPFNLFNLSRKKAQHLFHKAYAAQREANFHQAITLYQASIDCYPTAEAHTFLGWAYSFTGDLDAAIESCHEAIMIDPNLGNPYNDIGAYMIAQGRYEEAFDYLQHALSVPRYLASHYAHFNLGRVYESRGDMVGAYRHYKQALEVDPTYEIAVFALERIKSQILSQDRSKKHSCQTSA